MKRSSGTDPMSELSVLEVQEDWLVAQIDNAKRAKRPKQGEEGYETFDEQELIAKISGWEELLDSVADRIAMIKYYSRQPSDRGVVAALRKLVRRRQ